MLDMILKPANLFTSASLLCGVSSVMWSAGADGNEPAAFFQAALLIVFAGIFDGLDGRVARMTHTQSEFGVQLDSLVDVVSFGVAPAYLAYVWGLGGTAGDVDPGALIAFVFVVCGALRLARFNVAAAEGAAVDRFEGLPIPAGALILASFVMMVEEWDLEPLQQPLVVAPILLFAAALMVSRIPFQSFKKFKTRWGMVLFYGNLVAGLLELAGLLGLAGPPGARLIN